MTAEVLEILTKALSVEALDVEIAELVLYEDGDWAG